MEKIELAGRRFGRLTVIRQSDKYTVRPEWVCRCDCGSEVTVKGECLRTGGTRSCGCLKKEKSIERQTRHGFLANGLRPKLYDVWEHIKQRCYNQNNEFFNRYGGRGIGMCDEWRNDFQAFISWAESNGYKEGLTIDRIDNDGNYEPGNCRWVTNEQNCGRNSRNVKIECNGVTHNIAEWARLMGFSRHKIIYWLKAGKTPEEIFTFS